MTFEVGLFASACLAVFRQAMIKHFIERRTQMTYYYYIASDKPLQIFDGQISDCWPVDDMDGLIPECKLPIQLEMISTEKEQVFKQLYGFLQVHFKNYPKSTVQIIHYLNSNIEDCPITKKATIIFENIGAARQLMLDVGEMMTINKK